MWTGTSAPQQSTDQPHDKENHDQHLRAATRRGAGAAEQPGHPRAHGRVHAGHPPVLAQGPHLSAAVPVVGPRNTKLRDRDAFDAWYRATILDNPKRRGNATTRADQPQRVGPGKFTLAEIAERLNLTVEAVRYYVRTAKGTDDPFPAGQGGDGRGGGAYDGREVDAWLRRRRGEVTTCQTDREGGGAR
ncbi:hypothetical protein ACU686_26570 [Yinghuangia aomiensis]